MSMSLFMGLQSAGVFFAYMFVTVGLPSLAFEKRFRHLRLGERLTAYYIIGNFFVINLVFALQLLKISNRFTLMLCTILAVSILYIKSRGISLVKVILSYWESFDRILEGQLGVKTVLYRSWKRFQIFWGKVILKLKKIIFQHFVEWVILIVFTLIFLKIYGTNIIESFGYGASDMPVHNYWINYLGKNRIFVAGIYPFGFHNVIYYFHEVFNINTYVILRVFCLTQHFLVNMMLLGLLKYCCRSRYTPYLGVFAYSVMNIFGRHTYSRFSSSLPQEFGMIFIYPTVYFAFAFFKERKERRPSNWYLAGFAMSFSMTLAVHFYGTMIAGLFCVGIAVGFFARFIRWEYFKRIVITCVISVVLAVLPMGIAFAGGTPLQGSLGWGMNILMGNRKEKETANETKSDSKTDSAQAAETESGPGTGTESASGPETAAGSKTGSGSGTGTESLSGPGSAVGSETENSTVLQNGEAQNKAAAETNSEDGELDSEEPEEEIAQISPFQRIVLKIKDLPNIAVNKTRTYIFSLFDREVSAAFYLLTAGVIAAGMIMILFRQTDYGEILISTGVYIICLALLLISGEAGLPTLMDPSRCSIYMAYAVPLVLTLAADVVLFALLGWTAGTKLKCILHIVSMILLAVTLVFCQKREFWREPVFTTGFQTNEAVTCLTNILREEEDFKWTICSANDELRMGEDHGYHYETIEFLRKMEGSGDNAMITIPTETVYFFIEKKPLDYAVKYEGSGQFISEKLAARGVPRGNGLSIYQAENRCIVMSRLYFWAQEFLKMYPNEMKVYFETENFVCYKISQNMYRLYNFAIDYGYNTQTYEN